VNLTAKSVDKLLPGITGWAQVNGRDELSIPDKVALDVESLNRQSFWLDVKILWMTFLKAMNCLNSIFVPKLARILQKWKSSYLYKMFHIKL
jgi:lipopolysaccharide/colanic/teichoic acid biosynthesis glycosyltransferase